MLNKLKETILFIDGFNIIISQNNVTDIVNQNSEPIGTYLGTINQIRSFVDLFRPIKVFFIMDGPNSGERRRKILPEYKNKRRVVSRTSKTKLYEDEEDTEKYEVQGAYENQLKKIHEVLKMLPVTICIVPYCEADDVISNLAIKNQDKYRSVIVSTDKDYLQLVNENINVYNWRKKMIYDENSFQQEHQILPCNYIFKKIILGDNSDEIKGIKSLGKKTFERIFQDSLRENKYLELQDFLKFIESIKIESLEKKDVKHLTNLLTEETKKHLIINFKLMKLSSDYLKLQHIEVLKQQIEQQKNKSTSYISLKVQLMNDSFNKIYGSYSSSFNIDNWLRPFKMIRNNIETQV